ncbi:MAG: cysteine hydrolase family protein [Gammaproteobacteria bacterium]
MFEIDFPVVPRMMALINVDMQNCFVHGYPFSAPDGLELQDRINHLATVCRKAGVTVIHTSHVIRPDGSNIGVMGEIIPPVKEGMINKGSESAALHAGLVVEDTDILLDKPRFGAFHGTDLDLILRLRDIDTVIITGIATNICCETTAREANMRDFRIFFMSDGTSTFSLGELSKDDIQKVTCATLGAAFAQVITVDEMIARIKATSVEAELVE